MLKLGMITCNFFSGVYNYNVPADMKWPDMVKKHYDEFDEKKLVTLLETIRGYGIDYVELWEPHASYKTLSGKDAQRIRSICLDKGLTPLVYCIGGWRHEHLDIIERGFEFAEGLGANVINGVIQNTENEEVLAKIDDCCKRYKIRFSIENHASPALESPEEVQKVLDSYSDYIGANLDVGIYHRTGYDVLKAAKLFGDRIYHVHFKDVVQGAVRGSCPSGEGAAPLKELAAYLKGVNYPYMVSIEYEPRFDPTEDLKRSVAYCKSIC